MESRRRLRTVVIVVALILCVGGAWLVDRANPIADRSAGDASVRSDRSDPTVGQRTSSGAPRATVDEDSAPDPGDLATSDSDPGDRARRAGSAAHDEASRPDPGSLDHAPARVVAARLDEAISLARRERGVPISRGLVDRVLDDGAVPIIVMLTPERPALEPRLAGSRHEPAHYYNNIPFAALEVGPQALLDIVESHDVLAIEADRKHEPTLAATVPLISADAAQASGFDGSGRVIAVLDTGVDTSHPAFTGRVVDEACFSRDGDCPGGGTREFGPGTGAPCAFGCGHGTLVAGVALGLDPAGTRDGVAPDSGLFSIMIFSDDAGAPTAYTSDIVAGLDHVYDMRLFHAFAAVNLSLGGDLFSSTADCDAANIARKAAIDRLRGIGVPTIIASGNDSDTGNISEPACISTAVSVGATTKSDTVSTFSNSASFLSLLAPGQSVQTTRMGGGFATASGTSIAAPHVAGAWAAILEAVPGSNVAEVLFALQSTGQPIIDLRNGITTPRIDVAEAIMALDAGIDIEDPATTGGGATVPPAVLPSDACGLIGIELVLPLWGVRAVRRSRRVAHHSA